MLEAPENYEENFEKISPSQIKIGDYILYLTKEREYKGNKYPQRWCQGYISLIPDEEKGRPRWGDDYKLIYGFINRGRPWTIRTDNVLEFYKSKIDPKVFREKAISMKEKKVNKSPEKEINKKSRKRQTIVEQPQPIVEQPIVEVVQPIVVENKKRTYNKKVKLQA
ncbi:hypothetical protein LLG07_06310 [bacterium]|jgi:hypothetical protein|nr:hypothetical protein [bacterium]